MNLTDFSLLKEDNDTYTIGHPKGRSITVPKKGMSDVAQKLVSRLKRSQNLADGTPEGTELVDEGQEEEQPAEDPVKVKEEEVETFDAPSKTQTTQAPMTPDEDIPFPPAEEEAAPMVAQPEPSLEAPAPVNPEPSRAPAWDVMSGEKPVIFDTQQANAHKLNKLKETQAVQAADPHSTEHLQENIVALQNQAQAEKFAAEQDTSDALALMHGSNDPLNPHGPQKGLYEIINDYNTADADLQEKSSKLMQAVEDGQIDPNRFYANQSTGSKIAAAIGMAISGIGSGLTGRPNMAAEMINKAVDEDIKAQINDQTHKQNLWKMNKEAIGNNHQAYLAAKEQALTMAAAKMQKNASFAKSTAASSRIASETNALKGQIQAINKQRAIFQTLNQPRQNGLLAVDPSTLVNYLVPPAARAEVNKEIANRQNNLTEKRNFMKVFDEAEKQMGAARRAGRLGFVPPQIHAMEGMLLPLLRDKSGQVTDYELDIARKNFPSMLTKGATSEVKRKFFNDLFDSKAAAPVAKSYGIDLDKFKSTSLEPDFKAGMPVKSKKTGKQYVVGSDGRTLHPK